MGALANATALRENDTFRAWVLTAIAYQSRLVLTGDTAVPANTSAADKALRLKLAKTTAVLPQQVLELCVTAIACDPNIANLGSTGEAVGETNIINGVANIWTTVAQIQFPNG